MKALCGFLLLLLAAEAPVRQPNVGAGEGPAWDGQKYLYFTGGGRISRRDPSGKVEVFREDAGRPNGLIFDHEGRLIVCESGNRRVVRIEKDGSTTVLADRFEGKRFNSPNDLAIDSRGRLYFSDPRYGNRDGMELPEAVYRIDAPGKLARITSNEVERPNGLYVSPGDEYLYVADNNNNNVGGARKLWQFRLQPDGSLGQRRLVFDWGTGRGPDGIDMDTKGRLYVAAGRTKAAPPYETADRFKGGIYVLSPDGKLVEFIAIPDDEVTNCAFGGPERKTLFITAGGNLWTVGREVPGR